MQNIVELLKEKQKNRNNNNNNNSASPDQLESTLLQVQDSGFFAAPFKQRSPNDSITDFDQLKPLSPEDEETMNLLSLRSSFDDLVRLRGSGTTSGPAASAAARGAASSSSSGQGNNNGGNNNNQNNNNNNNSDVAESIPSGVFFEACFNEFFRVRSYRVAAFFTSFVLILWLILLLNRIDVLPESAAYFSQLGALRIMESEQFQSLETMNDMYGYLRTIIENLDKARHPTLHNYSAATPYPMGLLLIRQLRGSSGYCSSANTLFTGLRPRICTPDSTLTDVPFGSETNPTLYKANGQLPADDYVEAQDVSGIYVGMANSEFTFERHLYFSSTSSGEWSTATTTSPSSSSSNSTTTTMPPSTTTTTTTPAPASSFIIGKAAMLKEIDDLQANNFINDTSWSVAVDVAFVHPAPRSFTVLTMLMERLPSGALRPTIEQNTFLVTKLTGADFRAVLTFLSDLFIVVFLLYCVGELASDMYARFELSKDRITAFTDSLIPIVITLFQILTLISVLTDRFNIWSKTATASDNIDGSSSVEYTYRQTLHALSQISARLQSSYRDFSISILLCLARLFVFSESLDGLNMLSRAVRLNGAELVTVLVLSGVVVVMFAVAGNVFFDDELEDYSTIASTFSSLTRALSSSGTEPWMALAETSPRQAFFFFMMFWLTLWIVLLNMVLAIVVSAVDSVQRTAQEGQKFDTTWEVLKRHVLLLGSFYRGCRVGPEAQHRGGAAVAVSAAALTMPLPYNMRYHKWSQDYVTRYSAAQNAKAWALSGEKEVHLSDLNLVLNSVPLDGRLTLYGIACEAYSTTKALQATRSKTVDEVDSVTRQLDRQLSILERKLDLVPPSSAALKKRGLDPQRTDSSEIGGGGENGGKEKSGGNNQSRDNNRDEDDDEDSGDEVDHEVMHLRRMRSAIRSRGGVSEMLHTTKAVGGFLSTTEMLGGGGD